MLSRCVDEMKAYYVFKYHKKIYNEEIDDIISNPNLQQASSVHITDFDIEEKGLPPTVSSTIIDDTDLEILYHTGEIGISFFKDGVKGQTIYQPYDLEPELSKTKRFTHHLKNKLSHKYIIRDQIKANYYCEYTATVDLAIKKKIRFLLMWDRMTTL